MDMPLQPDSTINAGPPFEMPYTDRFYRLAGPIVGAPTATY